MLTCVCRNGPFVYLSLYTMTCRATGWGFFLSLSLFAMVKKRIMIINWKEMGLMARNSAGTFVWTFKNIFQVVAVKRRKSLKHQHEVADMVRGIQETRTTERTRRYRETKLILNRGELDIGARLKNTTITDRQLFGL